MEGVVRSNRIGRTARPIEHVEVNISPEEKREGRTFDSKEF